MLKKKVILITAIAGFIALISALFLMQWGKELEIKKENGAVNLLFLGIGGGTHEGPELTDTIIFSHIDIDKNTISLFSIPRDLWIPQLSAKINAAYALGNSKEKKGILLAKTILQDVVGKPIDYVIVIDFQGFIKLVDHLGGIEVDVQATFDDFQYPIPGKEQDLCGHLEEELPYLATASSELEAFPCRYNHIHFDSGKQHMNGNKALEYIRSRHAKGEEGTDAARSKRQQQAILAIKKRVLSLEILLNPAKVFGTYNIIKQNLNTNIDSSLYDDFIKLARKMENASIKSYVIDYGDETIKKEGLLINPTISETFGYQWVLIPRIGNGDFSEIHAFISCVGKGDLCEVNKEGITSKPSVTPQAR